MILRLVAIESVLSSAWRKYFGRCADVEILETDICHVACDAVVSPANSFGFMDGGLDLDLSLRFGWDVQRRLQALIRELPMRELLVGEALLVATEDRAVPWLISAPTMRLPMDVSLTVNAYLAMKAILNVALSAGCTPPIKTVAIPGLGTGVGRLDPERAAHQMFVAYGEVILGQTTFPADLYEASVMNHTLVFGG